MDQYSTRKQKSHTGYCHMTDHDNQPHMTYRPALTDIKKIMPTGKTIKGKTMKLTANMSVSKRYTWMYKGNYLRVVIRDLNCRTGRELICYNFPNLRRPGKQKAVTTYVRPHAENKL